MTAAVAVITEPITSEKKARGPKRFVRAIRAIPANTSLRLQLTLAVLIMVAAGLVISNFAGAAALRGYLLNRVDSQLVSTANDTFRRGYVNSGGTGEPSFNQNYDADGPMLSSAFFTEVTDTTGKGTMELRVPTGSKQSAPRLPNLKFPVSDSINGKAITVSATDDGANWRVLVTTLPDNSGALTVGTTLDDVNSTVTHLQFIDVVVSAIVLALLGLIASLVVHGSLRRLSQVEAAADAIAKGDLGHRAPNWSTNTEVGRMASSFNSMLEQIEASFSAQQLSEEEARASEERMRRFVADASHELRTPLTSIRGFAELRRQGVTASPELVDHSLARIESEAKRMTLLVEDLLLLARLDQQRPLEQAPVDLVAIATELVQGAPIIAPEHKVSLELCDGLTSLTVLGDEARLHQVLANLINNAYTHTPAGTDVRVRLIADGEQAVVEVQDTGPGMESREAARAFERFYRADPARTRAQGGAGLGLSIVAGIVEAHGGKVSVTSAPGQGATFRVSLPKSPSK